MSSTALIEVIPSVCSYWSECSLKSDALDGDETCCPDEDGRWSACCCLIRGTLVSVSSTDYVAWTNGAVCCDDMIQHNAYIIDDLVDVSCTNEFRSVESDDLLDDPTFRLILIISASILGLFATIGSIIFLRNISLSDVKVLVSSIYTVTVAVKEAASEVNKNSKGGKQP
eukprot:6212748-Pleurochrysis_carterae.AAC.2